MVYDYTRRVCSEGFLPLPRHDGLSRLFAIHLGFKGICLPLYIDVPEALNVPDTGLAPIGHTVELELCSCAALGDRAGLAM